MRPRQPGSPGPCAPRTRSASPSENGSQRSPPGCTPKRRSAPGPFCSPPSRGLRQAGRAQGSGRSASRPHCKRELADGWSRTRSEAPILARNAVTATSQAYARLADKAAVISVRGRDQASIAFGRTVRTSDALGVAFRKWASTNAAVLYAEAATRAQPTLKRTSASWTRTLHRSKRLGSALQAQLSDNWCRTRSSAPIFARNIAGSVFKAASETWSQAALRTQRILARRDPPHRALIVRQCTALACIEPRRARLPVIRAS